MRILVTQAVFLKDHSWTFRRALGAVNLPSWGSAVHQERQLYRKQDQSSRCRPAFKKAFSNTRTGPRWPGS